MTDALADDDVAALLVKRKSQMTPLYAKIERLSKLVATRPNETPTPSADDSIFKDIDPPKMDFSKVQNLLEYKRQLKEKGLISEAEFEVGQCHLFCL